MEIMIGNLMRYVKIQILSGDKNVTKVSTVKVYPDSGATVDLIHESITVSLGCKIRKDTGN